ncbi:MAG: hypothetical protein ACRD1H_18010, partial [Vicinamibacterales bacterium]
MHDPTKDETSFEHFADALESYRLDRRSLLRRATAVGLGASSIVALLAACGGDDEEPAGAEPA